MRVPVRVVARLGVPAGPLVAPGGPEPEGRRLRFFANGRRYGEIDVKSNVDGIGSGSSAAVPYVTTITV